VLLSSITRIENYSADARSMARFRIKFLNNRSTISKAGMGGSTDLKLVVEVMVISIAYYFYKEN
jgi:hypothetical protein